MGMMASGGINLLPDHTIFFQLVTFLLVVVVVNFFVIRPTLHLLRRRTERSSGAEAQAKILEREAVEDWQAMETALDTERREVLTSEEGKRRKSEGEAVAITTAARERASEQVETERLRLAELAGHAQADINTKVPELAQLILTEIVGTNGKGER